MKQYVINFTGVKTVWYFYEALIKGLEMPDWCGKNPDAIWDLLTGYIEFPDVIYLKGLKSLPKDLNEDKEIILRIFRDANEFYEDEHFEIKILS